jgi:hypothetical protein
MSFPPELESTRVDRAVELEPRRFFAPTKLERWERVERIVLLSFAALLIAGPIVRLSLGGGDFTQLLLLPFGIWCIWQAFFEDRLESGVPPSVGERLIATGWLWVRRLVLWAIGVPLSVYSAIAVVGAPDVHAALGPLGGLFIGVFSIWVGAFGAGRATSTVDDLSVHSKRKRRYEWKW